MSVSSVVRDIGAAQIAYTQSALDPSDHLRSFLLDFTLAQILYQTFWKPSGIAPTIETRTSRR